MFERIVKVAGESRADKYASTYRGKQPTDLASITEAATLADLLATASPKYRNGLSLPTPRIIATGIGIGKTEFNSVDMLLDGFPVDKPAHLHLLYEFGPKRNEDDDAIQQSKGFKKLEVFDAAYRIAAHGEQGYLAVFADLERN
jgi:hypothetical protein